MSSKNKLNSIIKKGTWTGEEVGRLIVTNAVDGYIRVLQGEKDPKPIFSQEQLDDMTRSLGYGFEMDTYNRYVRVLDWLYKNLASASTSYQQFNSELRLLVGMFETITVIETSLSEERDKPIIMTQEKYNEVKSQKLEDFFNDEDSGYNLSYLVMDTINYYDNLLHSNPRKKNPLKKALKDIEGKVVSSDYITRYWSYLTDKGYYIFSDGTTSKELSYDELGELFKKGKAVVVASTDNIMDDVHALFLNTNIRVEEIIQYIYPSEAEAPDDVILAKYVEEELTEDIAMGRVLELLPISELYDYASDPTSDFGKRTIEGLTSDLSELVDISLDIINNDIFKGKTSYKRDDMMDDAIILSYKEAYEIDLYGTRELFESDSFIFSDWEGANSKGIAVLSEGDSLSKYRMKDGIYPESDFLELFDKSKGIKNFFPENDPEGHEANFIYKTRRDMMDSFKYIVAFDVIIEALENYLNIDNFAVFKMGATKERGKLEAYDQLIDHILKNRLDFDSEEYALKRHVFETVFQKAHPENFQLDKDRVATVINGINNGLKLFEGGKAPHLLTYITGGSELYD